MKHVGFLAVSFTVLLTWVSGAGALEVKDKAKAPPGWWEMTAPTAIPPQYFDQVLSAYGLTLVDVSKAPANLCPQGRRQGRLGDGATDVHADGDGPDPLRVRGEADRPREEPTHVRARS